MRQNHYYPYGLKHSNYNAIEYAYKENELGTYVVLDPTQRSDYRYKYNGMEFQDELGLNLYDMEFRDYDPAIARWTGIDPVTHHNMSPYMAFDGNPVFWADPSGADSIGGNALDVFGRDRFDSSGMYIPFADRGVGSFDEYLSQDGGGDGGGDPITRFLEIAVTLDQWAEIYADMSLLDILNQEPLKDFMPGGPTIRYVINPIDGNVMDMRHVAVVGYLLGTVIGDIIEVGQYMKGRHDTAFDRQDYYSNNMGEVFYKLRGMGSWASDSWAYDFKRFILTQYLSLQSIIIPK